RRPRPRHRPRERAPLRRGDPGGPAGLLERADGALREPGLRRRHDGRRRGRRRRFRLHGGRRRRLGRGDPVVGLRRSHLAHLHRRWRFPRDDRGARPPRRRGPSGGAMNESRSGRERWIVGNWKQNLLRLEAEALARAVVAAIPDEWFESDDTVRVGIAPTYLSLEAVRPWTRPAGPLWLFAQDV